MKFLILSLFFFSLPTWALEVGQPVTEIKFEDQFSEGIVVSSETKHVIFVADKEMSKVMTEYLSEAKPNLKEMKTVYVSDISKMPSLITKTFALPKMRKYDFKVALDRTGDLTKSWPRQEKKITIVDIVEGKVSSIRYLGTRAEIETLFKSF
jgi:hypothetical protein